MTSAHRLATRSSLRALTHPPPPILAGVHPPQAARAQVPIRRFHKNFNSQLEDQTATLSDGRTIGFAEYGTPHGIPTFFFHGAPGSRYDGFGYSEPATRLGVRIICPDRPGHGFSSPDPGRTLSGYARDISQLAGHLGVERYHVFGQSGGGPYAVACAAASPVGELMNATVVAGMGHPSQITRRVAGLYTVCALGLHARFPGVMRRIMDWVYRPAWLADDEKVRRSLRRMYRLLSEEDRAVMEEPQTERLVLAVLRAAFAQGSQGTIGDSLIYYGPWDFELADVRRRVLLVFGDKDNRTPLAFGRHYKEWLPDAELVVLEGCSHFTIERYVDDILARVVGEESLAKGGVIGEAAEKGAGTSTAV